MTSCLMSSGSRSYIYNLDENLARLFLRNLTHGTYRPRPLREIDVPKTGLSVRPGSSLEIEDHIVFFGIAYLLAPVLDRVLPDSVFHFRVRKKGDRPHPRQLFLNEHRPLLAKHLRKRLRIFGDWYEVWPEFMAEAQKLYAEKGFNFLVESDISAFFENISHPLLADVLRQHAPPSITVDQRVDGNDFHVGDSLILGNQAPARNSAGERSIQLVGDVVPCTDGRGTSQTSAKGPYRICPLR